MKLITSASAALFASVTVAVLASACASGDDNQGAGGTTANDAGSSNGHDASLSGGGGGDDDGSIGGGGDDGSVALPTDGATGDAGCDAGVASCNGVCADLASDVNNCGACGNECSSGQMCVAGACGCKVGYSMCASGDDGGASVDGGASFICANEQTDNNHCGSCSDVCPGLNGCSGGVCVSAAVVDDSGNCTMVDGAMNHSLAVDSMGRVYAALICGGAATVSVSSDGATFAAGVSIAISADDTIESFSLAASGTSVYAAIGTDAGTYFSRTTDGGATWSAPTTLATVGANGFLQIASGGTGGTNVYVAVPGTVYRNSNSGTGAFTATQTTATDVWGGIGVATDGTVWLASSDSTTVSLASSTDSGQTFSAFAGAGAANVAFPSFGFGGASLALAGTTPSSGDDDLVSIAYAAPTVETVTSGLEPVSMTANARTVAVDATGDVYTFGTNGSAVIGQEYTNGQLSAAAAVLSDQDIQNVAVAAGSTAKSAYGMWIVGSTVRIFHFAF